MTYPRDNYDYSQDDTSYSQGNYDYSQGNASNGNYGDSSRFDMKQLVTNLLVLTVLAGVVAFAVIFLISAIINTAQGQGLPTVGEPILLACIAAIIGLVISLIYIPIYGTGNENLYRAAIIALATVAIVVYVILGGLLQGDWSTLLTLAVFLCAAAIAMMAPQRIADAANY